MGASRVPKQMGMEVFIDAECIGGATEYILQASLRDTFAALCYKKRSPGILCKSTGNKKVIPLQSVN